MDFILCIIHSIVNEEVETIIVTKPIRNNAIECTVDRHMPTNQAISYQNKQIQSVYLF